MIYDEFQKKAIEYIDQGHSVIVSAPTGAGKTAIAEYVIQEALKRGQKVIYTAPIKALSNQKFRDFQATNPDMIGLLTGDVTINASAPVLIMTTEIFRNKILDPNMDLSSYGWIIFDEIHYIDDQERGTVWEESLIFMPEHMRLLGLSATIPNIDELKDWLESIHKQPIKIVKEDKRPVPLKLFFQCQSTIYTDWEKLAKYGYQYGAGHCSPTQRVPHSFKLHPNRLPPLIEDLQARDRLPCIYFVFSRKQAEFLAEEIMTFDFLNSEQKTNILGIFDELCIRFDLTGEPSASKLRSLISRGVAYHHAGMLPTLKEVVEQIFTQRLLKMIFTTETFALGINMPARTVIFDELSKYYGRSGFETLRTRDFYQMAGRAGRRSIDVEGFVFCRVNPHYISAAEVNRVVYGKPEKVNSQFNASYATILNLYRVYGEKLYDIYPQSFHYYQESKNNRTKAMYSMKAKVDILKELGYIDRKGLTEKGEFASQIYGYELILSELFEAGFLDQLSLPELAILIGAIIYEPRKGMTKPRLSHRTLRIQDATNEVLKGIHRLERATGSRDRTKMTFFHLTDAIESWVRGKDFGEVSEQATADEGEIVRYFRMIIQVLRQMAECPVTEEFRTKLRDLVRIMNRDVVDSEKQLRS
ncbi:MAG: DEAD/DEAH box helicase [Candidatus Omnitrophica bacterium]|nr:DEAD/DEAH box helicase [Candidatus Omnitrophota bacterium]